MRAAKDPQLYGQRAELPLTFPFKLYGAGKKPNAERDYSEFALLASGILSEEPKHVVSTEREIQGVIHHRSLT